MIGVFGGTFDPIHIGHLYVAQAAAETHGLDRILFVPVAAPAHRETHSSPAHRRAMVARAIDGNPMFALDDTGLEQPAPAYTADTLALLRKKYPGDALYFIAGIDSLTRSRWRRLDEVAAALERFLVAARDGVDEAELAPVLSDLAPDLRAKFERLDSALTDVSSTTIRELVRQNRSIRYLAPDAVVEYIKANGLYR